MQIISLVDFCSVRPQTLGVDLYISLLSVDCELLIGRAFDVIESWKLGCL